MTTKSVCSMLRATGVGVLAASIVLAQDTTGGWKRVGDSGASTQTAQDQGPVVQDQNQNGYPNANDGQQPPVPYPNSQQPPANPGPYPSSQQPPPNAGPYPYPNSNYPGPTYPNSSYPAQQPQPAPYGNQQPVPPQITIPVGTYLTVRMNQGLSSDHNQPGDPFTATMVQPLVVNGVVVAEPGETISGRVAQAQKAGRVSGVSRLGVELTELTLVDGQQIPIHTTLVGRKGDTSVGRDAAAIGGTTALGAAAGAAADWGRGAAIGAGAGAFVGIVGVLLTRGQPTIIHPEQVLAFRLDQPLTISTTNAPQAFHYVQPHEYSQAGPGPYNGPQFAAGPMPPPAPYYYPYAYYGPYWGYPYWGPGFSVFVGRGYWGPRYYGFHRR